MQHRYSFRPMTKADLPMLRQEGLQTPDQKCQAVPMRRTCEVSSALLLVR
jgi:hypothetical protein